MKTLFTIITVLLCTLSTQAQTWESLYTEYSQNDPFFEQEIFQVPKYDSQGELQSRTRTWRELKPKAKRTARNHIQVFYQVKPSGGGYLLGALQTTGRSIGRVAIYIGTMTVAAIVVGTLTNQSPR
ncbi:MAG: hypothetical protein P8J32_01550 [bacterium]|nr:hypothetical protein [bacterium]